MRLIGSTVCWSATDLTRAATCEYALLRRLDERLGRGDPRPTDDDPLEAEVARVGELHEAEVRTAVEAGCAPGAFVELGRPPLDASPAELAEMQARTVATLKAGPAVVFQAGFFDGEFVGFADFLVDSDDGWVVSDAKLARQARPTALLQLGAYADQLERAGLPVAPHARLLLGDGRVDAFPLCDVMPVFRERRGRLRSLLTAHAATPAPVAWGDDRYVACGRCAWCRQAVQGHRDLLLVAGLRMSQRKRLRDAGAETIDDLAALPAPPEGVSPPTFERLRGQARLQVRQLDAERTGVGGVLHELLDGGRGLAMLPAPSPGDVFFDFEGDPLYRESDPAQWGLEYLWGVVEAPTGDGEPAFTRWWAHDRSEERRALVEFMEYVAARRAAHPDMHVYHYAPYETTALKRLAGRYATHQTELDDLLRSAVFVDLYAVVRSSLRVSQPSYSIKKLEPLYMPSDRADMDVAAGDVSIAEYHLARAYHAAGRSEEAEQRLQALEAYNRYDCVSTLRLRDWLLGLAARHGVADLIEPVQVEREGEPDEESDATVLALRGRAGPGDRTRRTADQQAYAMLASAVGYHRRESLPFWWEHFNRLGTPSVDDWSPDRDVFRVHAHQVLEGWHRPEGRQVLHRRLLLRGEWGAGSTPGTRATAVYRVPCPEGAKLARSCGYGWVPDVDIEVGEDDEGHVVLTERLARNGRAHDDVPVALTPPGPPHDGSLRRAIREVAQRVLDDGSLTDRPALDILRGRPPRPAGSGALPHTGDPVEDIVAALLRLDGSYVPVQGPPGTGKTWTGSRVVRRLVEEHGWRVGVVAQSHAVVENMLTALADAGLDGSRIAKKDSRDPGRQWVDLDGKHGRNASEFLASHEGSGCVLGGTAWTFTSERSVARGSLDLLVVDEAGQFSVANTVAVSVAARRLLLLGDPQQLPQVSQGTHDEPVGTSALGWLMQGSDTLSRDLGYFLATSYRMHPTLCERVSVLSYDGRLHAAPGTAARELEGVAPGLRTVLVEPSGSSVCSEPEADVVTEEVGGLLGRAWRAGSDRPRPLRQQDVLVVAPYNAQVQLLRRRLAAAGYAGVRVGTVDRFQGQEAPVVIVSMTASSASEVPRGMGFLLSRNRVNVAISRAQWLAVLVRSAQLTSYLPSSPERLLELGGFIGLSEPR